MIDQVDLLNTVQVQTQDHGRTWIGLVIVSEPLPKSSMLGIQFDAPPQNRIIADVSVVSCEPLDNGLFAVLFRVLGEPRVAYCDTISRCPAEPYRSIKRYVDLRASDFDTFAIGHAVHPTLLAMRKLFAE